jgi:two-component system, NtrC family, nitrogen regulation response regulator GlnG
MPKCTLRSRPAPNGEAQANDGQPGPGDKLSRLTTSVDTPRPPATDHLEPGTIFPIDLVLVVASGPDLGKELRLSQKSYRIGKGPENDFRLKDSAVSRNHLVIEVLPSSIRATDNGSTNGAFCNGMRFTTLEVKPGSVLRIGRTEMKLLPVASRSGSVAPSKSTRFGSLIGSSLPMREVFTMLERISQSDSDVLIHGETGTGKELCARAIHEHSGRAKAPFVVCDLVSIAPRLFESEIFGHVRGAFTGAVSTRSGAFERAQGGTLFLDEVGDLPLDLQPRLLRALERREVKRVGANIYRKFDVRVLAATNANLEASVRARTFREDLFHRLAGVQITLPPLRERPEDIPLLVDELLSRLGKDPTALSPGTRDMLAAHSWPGNVRELRNVVEKAIVLGGAPDALGTASPGRRPRAGTVTAERPFKETKEELVTAFERDYVADLLDRCGGNVLRAAKRAGMDRAYLHRLVKKHGLSAK